MYNYQTHHLEIQSEIRFPELTENNSSTTKGLNLPRIRITLGIVDFSVKEIISKGIFRVASQYMLTKESIYLIWNNIKVCEIRNKNEIIVNVHAEIDENFLRSLILGPALGIVLHLQGRLVLHASAVDVNGEAVAIMGHNGMGKSTTTMALVGQGYPLIADDILSIELDQEDNPLLHPGIARIKLWPEVYPRYSEYIKKISVIHPESPKRSCQLKRQSTTTLPLKHIYILEKADNLGLSQLNYSEALIELIRNSYCANIFQAEDEKSHFQDYAKIVQKVPIKYLNRIDSLDELEKLVEIIKNDVKAQK
ncbi:MAG: hypothetical protein QME14_03990 [Methanobacteriaceae archaeon]|nr:hypothetical protein [Methanobacteriaceae archaeon]